MDLKAKFAARIEKTPTCWLWAGAKGHFGYGVLKHDGKQVYAHRVAWRLSHGEIQNGQCVLHKCDTPACVNPAHLFLGTKADNARDRDAKGRHRAPMGERHANSKLTTNQARAIRMLRDAGAPLKLIAAKFGVSASNISYVALRKGWKHV